MFFTDEIIREFREETPEIKTYLMHHKKKLIHLEEIREFLQWTPEEEGRDDLYQFITKWTTKICGHGISDMYGASSLMIALSAPDKQFDAIFTVDEDYLEKLQEKSDVSDKLNLVYSVMIVQKGECELKPRTVAVRLICSRKTMKANILMGAYLYAIKKKGAKVDQTGILELADGFKNLQGFCLYTKFGFKEDKRLYVPVLWKRDTSAEKGNWRYKQNRDADLWVPDPTFYDFNKQTYKQKRKCFGNQENLPMSVDLTHITEEAIIKTTTTGSPIRKNTTLLQKSASVFQLNAVPKPQDLCTSLKAETAEESRVQSAIADLYSKMHNAELDVENNVFHTGQVMDDFQLRMKKDQIDVYKQNIKALRSTFKRKPRPTSSLFNTATTRKNRPTNSLWSSTLQTKTRSRSISPPHKKGTTKQNKSLRSSRSSSKKSNR